MYLEEMSSILVLPLQTIFINVKEYRKRKKYKDEFRDEDEPKKGGELKIRRNR